MKKILYTILFLSLIFIPSGVSADSLNFNFSATATDDGVVAASGNKNKIKVFISSPNGGEINSCTFSIVSPQSGAQFNEITGANDWTVSENSGTYTVSSEEGLTDSENKIIAYVEYTVTGDATITFSNITCSSASASGTHSDVQVNLKVADSLIVKVDGLVVTADIVPNVLAADKSSVLVSVTAANETIQNSVKIYARDTSSGDVLICSGAEASNCTVNFSANYFCTSDICNTLKIEKGAGDNIKFGIEASGVERSFFLLKEVTQAVYSDSSIATLKVYGIEIPLEKGKTDYTDIKVPYNTENISVQATLSDPEHYAWDEEDNPNKYDFLASTVNLIVRPKDPNALGANESAYAIHITFEGGDPVLPVPSSSSSSSKSDTPIIVSSSSSRSHEVNPQTGTSEVIIALILVGSLIFSIVMYKKNMNSYE